MRNQRDKTGLWSWLLAGFILTGLIACATAGRHGRTTPHLGDYTLIATGRTTGHTADWICANDTREPMLFQLDPGILYGPEEYQPLIFTDPVSVTVPPKTTATFPIRNSLCIDISRPAPPEGTALTYIGPSEIGPPPIPGADLGSLPGYTPTEGFPSMSIMPKAPGFEYPLNYTIDIQNYLTEAAPVLMAAALSLNETYDEMEAAGQIDTPLPAEMEEESVKQQTYWMFTSSLTGNEYKKTDLEENMKRDYVQTTGQPIEMASLVVQTDFYAGIDILWDSTFLPLAEHAHLINPASKWEGVDQMVWIDTGPGGGSYTLPDGSASLTFSPHLDQPVSGTFFSRTYEVPGLKSYGFYPTEVVNDVPAPKISLPLLDDEMSVSRRFLSDTLFFPIPKPRPGVGVSIPVAESEVLVSKPDEACVVPPDALVPPPAPEGYTYVGREVSINGIIDPALSIIDFGRPDSKDDLIHIRSNTRVADHVLICDWIVCHRWQPIVTKIVYCPVPADMLVPPADAPEPGMRYVGRTVTVGHATRPELCTAPNNRHDRPGDQYYIEHRRFIHEGVECEVTVGFLYEK